MEEFIELNNSSKHNIRNNKGNAIMIALLLLGLLAIFSFGVGNVSATTVYVNVSSGNDLWNGLSPVHTTGIIGPNKDIKTGINNVKTNGTLKIANGLYTGADNYGITINKNITLKGQSSTNTIINAQNHSVFTIPKGCIVNIGNLKLTQGNIAIDNEGTLTVTDCKFTGNKGYQGGAIYNGGLLTVKSSTFTDNSEPGAIGAAIQNKGTLTVTDSIFTGNSAIGGVGAAVFNGGILTVTGSFFTGNSATGGTGGAIENDGYGLTVRDSTFTGNSASDGGAIENDSGNVLNITGCTFTNNTAKTEGGAIDNNGGSLTTLKTISGCTFTNNTAFMGGAISNGGNLAVTDSNLIDNSARDSGGAIYNFMGNVNVQFNRIVGNSAITGNAIDNGATIVATTLNLINNWWGSNTGPLTGAVVGATVPSWLVLKLSAKPTTIGNYGHSAVTANINYNNLGNIVAGHLANGIPVRFTTTLGTVTQSSIVNGVAISTLTSGVTTGIATIHAYLDNQTLKTTVTIKDTIAPKVKSTNPVNGQRGFSKTGTLTIKFSENIYASKYYNSIKVKNMKTGKYVSITKSIAGNMINIKTSGIRTGNVWYEIIIPKAAIRDGAGNNLAINYVCKFQTKK